MEIEINSHALVLPYPTLPTIFLTPCHDFQVTTSSIADTFLGDRLFQAHDALAAIFDLTMGETDSTVPRLRTNPNLQVLLFGPQAPIHGASKSAAARRQNGS